MTGVDLAEEDKKFMEYLAENGWTGSVGDDNDDASSFEGEKGKVESS